MKKMSTYGKGSEDAVSPVIGVILMVAITVILAAVIAAFVFGMAGNVSKTRNVAVTAAKTTGNGIILTVQGGPDATFVNGYTYTLNEGVSTAGPGTYVGTALKFTGTPGKDHVVVTAAFTDGTSQVVLDTSV